MCGIAGIFGNRPIPEVAPLGAVLLNTFRHRGPDDHGWWLWSEGSTTQGRLPIPPTAGQVLLLHSRLSILDLSPAGWQPMTLRSGRYHMVFNGEIYNFAEIRSELEQLGVSFVSTSDSEVLMAAYARWGAAVLPRLVGMFACAIFDSERRTLFLARDFFGIKPLYYTEWNGGIGFSSEIRTLLELPGLERRADPQGIYDYLLFGITDHRPPATLFAAVRQLPPGHYLELSWEHPTRAEPRLYWQPTWQETEPPTSPHAFATAAEELRELFLKSVDLHLRSDVPVAAALSGGVDSSAIVMAMRKLLGKEKEIHTFSYIAGERHLSEERWIDLVSREANTIQHKVYAGAEDLGRDLEHLITIQGEPVLSTSMYAQYRVYKLVAEHGIKVVLDGQGADEVLGGYMLYQGARVTSLVRQGKLVEAVRFMASAARMPGVGPRILLYTGEFLLPPAWHRLPRRLVGESLHPAWLNRAWFAERAVTPLTPRRCTSRAALREQLVDTLGRTTIPKLLRYQDRNSMAFSIESRVPFLTPFLVEFLLAQPESHLLAADGTTKAVFRAALRGLVPDPILERRDKIGFITPQLSWLAGMTGWLDQIFQHEAADVPILNQDILLKKWEAVKAGDNRDHMPLWRWVNLIRWTRIYGVTF